MNDSLLVLRKMDLEDIPAVKVLEVNSNLSPWNIEGYEENLKNRDSINLVAEYKSENLSKIIGFIIARLITNSLELDDIIINDIQIEIYNLAVDSIYQRQGIGSKLLNECAKQLSEAEKLQIWLEVRVSNNSAIKFYSRMGFIEKYRRKSFYTKPPEDAVVMCLEK